ncbi:glycosyltransferase family 4 protein [Thermoanaerobacterium thermosaccharolyticum]|uniref:Glycosyltransferase n=1 Tax=Thermoanaerobacterium thermosaccharolyticum M0795 TaxID=698948 RepID=L0IKM3_THETR|nr:glycosyltransferase family 4 protein [Thermoanaerobacterium thermosaccharolyticum]AGB18532.1 glycosyltransferase [Thermoanaerobacterium thermosaccharolyticum M0795]
MNLAIITNIRSPYRKLQIEEFTKIPNININVYYTNKNILGRKWNVEPIKNADETVLKGFKMFKKFGYINLGLFDIVKKNDLIIIGGYEQPTYILLSLLCRLYKKPYIIIFDGISPKKVDEAENPAKFLLKSLVIKHANSIFGNGTVSKLYFSKKFNYNPDNIFNQYLTVDIDKIVDLGKQKEVLRKEIRKKLNIDNDKKVIIYSGRLIKRKKVDSIIKAINILDNNESYILLILGDGEEKENLLNLAKEINVNLKITGFISNQEQLFKHYFVGDVLILPSNNEPWGLVVNEAMAAGLAVIVSDECGCSLDLVRDGENGFVIHAGDVKNIANAIKDIFKNDNYIKFGERSKEIIGKWKFEDSRSSFEKMLYKILHDKGEN